MTGVSNSSANNEEGGFALEYNEQMLAEAKKLASLADAGKLSLPAKLPTFEKIWIGAENDQSINFMTAVRSEKGTVYIVGARQ